MRDIFISFSIFLPKVSMFFMSIACSIKQLVLLPDYRVNLFYCRPPMKTSWRKKRERERENNKFLVKNLLTVLRDFLDQAIFVTVHCSVAEYCKYLCEISKTFSLLARKKGKKSRSPIIGERAMCRGVADFSHLCMPRLSM